MTMTQVKTSAFTIKKNTSEKEFETVQINNSRNCYDYIKQFYGDDIDVWESFFILLLNRNSKTIGYAKISQGGITGTVVDVKIIAKYCIDSLSSCCVLAHNHPSGNTQPSVADKELTQKVIKALELIDVKVLDHIILTSESYYSFADNGIL
jgi:DNA repair protein RadC